MAQAVEARTGYDVYARLQLVKTVSEAHGKPMIRNTPSGQHTGKAREMCKDLASKFKGNGMKPFPGLVRSDGTFPVRCS